MRIRVLFFVVVMLSSCYHYDDPNGIKHWIGKQETRNTFGVVQDLYTGGKLDSVLIGEKRFLRYIVKDQYFDSLAIIGAPLKRFLDSCWVSTFSVAGDFSLKDTIYYHENNLDGRIQDMAIHPKTELLFAYKKGYRIWRFDPAYDTLTTIPDDSDIGIKEFHLSTIRLIKL